MYIIIFCSHRHYSRDTVFFPSSMAASAPLPSVVMRLKRLLWDHQRSLVVWNAEIETATGLTFKIKMIIPNILSKESMREDEKRADENESTNDRRTGHATNERRSPLCKIRTAHSAPMTEMNPVRCGCKLLVLSHAFLNFHLHSDDCLFLPSCVCACVVVVLLSPCLLLLNEEHACKSVECKPWGSY
jgi:hypothetical protein